MEKLVYALKEKIQVLTRAIKTPEWKNQLISSFIQRNFQLYHPEQWANKSSSIIYPLYPHNTTRHAHRTEAVRASGTQAEPGTTAPLAFVAGCPTLTSHCQAASFLVTNSSNVPRADVTAGKGMQPPLHSGLPHSPPICHCNYFSISSRLHQGILSSKKTKLAISMTCTSEKTHPAQLWIRGKHSERSFNSRKPKPPALVYCLENLQWNQLTVYKESRARFAQIGLPSGLGCPWLSLPRCPVRWWPGLLCGLPVATGLSRYGLRQSLGSSQPTDSLILLESLDRAKINPPRHHSAWHAHSWAGI